MYTICSKTDRPMCVNVLIVMYQHCIRTKLFFTEINIHHHEINYIDGQTLSAQHV